MKGELIGLNTQTVYISAKYSTIMVCIFRI